MYTHGMTQEKNDFHPTALPAPDNDVVPLTLTMVGDLLTASKQSPRQRMLQPLHKDHADPVHRMFNGLQPGTYIPPHRHLDPQKSETVLVVAGAVLFVEFDDQGTLLDHTLLQPGTETFGVDVAPNVYHTYVALKPDTLIFEVKTGPYDHDTDKGIPDWAPREGSPEAEAYLLALIKDLAERANAQAEAMKQEQEGEGTN
jgi:cupin fold WbuC family metalloprotein